MNFTYECKTKVIKGYKNTDMLKKAPFQWALCNMQGVKIISNKKNLMDAK